jgi:aminomethyltransferase
MLKRTPFYDFHMKAGAKMVDFAGWEMPLLYRSITEEHEHTRKSASIFDVSHMGRLYFTGKDVVPFLNRVLTRNVSEQKVGQSRYSLVCNENGGILDDIIVSRDSKKWLIVCNASNREKLLAWFGEQRRSGNFDMDMSDQTTATAMVAIQGPKVIDKIAGVLPVDVKALKRYSFVSDSFMLMNFTVFRSGYTGEDGVEVILPAKAAGMAMSFLASNFEKEEATIKPAGLGARDTLRLEAALPLYGHELNENIDPLSAGLAWAVDLNKEFIGVEKLREIAAAGPKRKLVGLELEGRRIARADSVVLRDNRTIGTVTSGTFGPTVQKSIALAYIDANDATVGNEVQVDLKGTTNPAKIVPVPFYKRPAKAG